MSNNDVYWSEFVNILDIQFHKSLFIIDKYNHGTMSGSAAACILGTVKVQYVLVVCAIVFLLFSFISVFSV